ncbi:hypothetical protein [Nocardia bovistercoris]|uniref:Lipoprotein n=1 Tax=Nocardia bovistercoris TaxID=2785916 RepID=A0A931IK10_9NOCA|nr:hypothetical protein [Nocardia bovistercoris]MBH0781427.1 hypothetical protein [Nocardia bovistercoris]
MIKLCGAARLGAMIMAAGVVIVAGCGSNDDSMGATETAPLSTAREQLLLTEQEFPAGAKREEVSIADLLEVAEFAAEALEGVPVTPPDCARIGQEDRDQTKDLLAQSAVVGAKDERSGAVYTETIAGSAADLSRISADNQACSEVTMTHVDEGGTTTYLTKVEALTVPAALKGIEAIVYRTTSISTYGERKPSTSIDYTGHAVLRGVTVSLHVSSERDAPNESSFTKLFTDAVDKVRKAA